MPLDNYGVLKGRAIALRREHHDYTPHYQIHIDAEIAQFRFSRRDARQLDRHEKLSRLE